jgi:26S proteasome regulatory subunit T4
VSSAIVDKYIGESARVIREMFGMMLSESVLCQESRLTMLYIGYARDHQPCIIFMDEIDAIGGRRFSEGTSADREIQRTLMEVLQHDMLAHCPFDILTPSFTHMPVVKSNGWF